MFEDVSYLGYTLLFTLPPLILLWSREAFREILLRRIRGILTATLLLTLYGITIWPVALSWGAWAYDPARITGIQFGVVFLEDLVWWLLISFLFASFIVVARHYEDRGTDIILHEARALLRSFGVVRSGFSALLHERNGTIHVAAAAFAVLLGVFFSITAFEWALVVLAIGLVFAAELFNSSLERQADMLEKRHDVDVQHVKDTAAAGTSVAALIALLLGGIVFLPYIPVSF